MDDPLENNEYNRPQKEVCNPKPGEALIKKKNHSEKKKRNWKMDRNRNHPWRLELQLTMRFKIASPNKNTALTVCIFIINCHKKK